VEEIKGASKNFEIVELEKKIRTEEGKGDFLVEFLKQGELGRGGKKISHIYVATMSRGVVRGNHYHKKKTEWFSIFNGMVKVATENIRTKKRDDFILDSSGKSLKRVRINTGVAHAFKNISNSNVVLVAYSSKVYDSKKPDTYEYKLL